MLKSRTLWRGILLVLITSALTACSAAPAATPTLPDGVDAIDPPLPLTDFTLTNQNSMPAHLSDLKGKLLLMTFGYTHCPDVCPVTLANFKQIRQFLGDSAAHTAFAFVSVDGTRDTPPVLAKYLNLFDSSFIGWTGDDAAMQPIARAFGVAYFIDNATLGQADYTVTHTSSLFLVDQKGRLRRVYAFDTKPQSIATDMQQMLRQDGG